MAINVGRLDHYNVSTRNLGATVRFYEDVLGFVNGPRPPFDFPGAWLYSDGHPVLRIPLRHEPSGALVRLTIQRLTPGYWREANGVGGSWQSRNSWQD